MLITCKCLNIQLNSICSDLPEKISSVNVDGNRNQIDYDFDIQLSSADTITSSSASTIPSAAAAAATTTTTTTTTTTITKSSSSPSSLIPASVLSSPQKQPIQQCTIKKINGDYLHFFKTAKTPSASLLSIFQQPDLVHVTLIEHWNVYLCMHCKTITHAQSDETNEFLVDPPSLTNQEKMDMLRNDENYSKTFGIVILNNSSKELKLNKPDTKHKNMSARIKNLRKLLHDAKQKEMEETEARIARFTKQQTNLLKLFCDKAEQDYQDIISVLDDVPDLHITDGTIHNETITGSISANAKLLSELTPPVTPDSAPMSIGNSPNFKQQPTFLNSDINSGSLLNKKTNSKIINHSYVDKTYQRPNANADADIFFDIDGIDTTNNNIGINNSVDAADFEVDDFDDDDEQDERNGDTIDTRGGIRISSRSQRQRLPKACIAQSLPMAVPIYNQRSDDDYDEDYAEDNVDIAASIKALAKSVHGEAIFGDLPRPRFSTQI